MNTTRAIAISFLLALSGNAGAQAVGAGAPETPADSPDSMFVQRAGTAAAADVDISRLAVANAQSADVRKFAEAMVQEHERNNRELATIAAHENIGLPKEIDDRHAQLRAQLAVMHGSNFDHFYVETMRRDQERLAQLLRESQATVSTPELRTYIATTLPIVQDHLQTAQAIRFE